jgi:hypothetical protein
MITEWTRLAEEPEAGVGQRFSAYVQGALRDPRVGRVPVSGTASGDDETLYQVQADHAVRSLLPLILEDTGDRSLAEVAQELRGLAPIGDRGVLAETAALLRQRFDERDVGVEVARAYRQALDGDDSRPPSQRELALIALELTAVRLSQAAERGFRSDDPTSDHAGFPAHYEWPVTALPYLAVSAGVSPDRVNRAICALVQDLATHAWPQP